MTLKDFQNEARRRGNFHDNTKNAMACWSKCWGLGFHNDLWCYKQYTLGNLTYKSGNVVLRHGHYRNTVCYIDGQMVSEYKFKQALQSFIAPAVSDTEQKYIDETEARIEAQMEARRERRVRRMAQNNQAQLVLDFDVA